MKCPKCGKEIADDSNFCEFCGVKISQQRSFKVLWIVLLFLLGLSVLGVCSFYVYDMYKQHEKEVAEAKAAQEEAEQQAKEALRLAEEAREKARQDSIARHIEEQERVRLEKIKAAKKAGYVDLSLPSGTLWKRKNENGYFTNDEAKRLYRKKLPSIDQFTELVKHCRAVWSDGGFRFIGDNGQSIFIKADGYKSYTGEIEEFGSLISCYTNNLFWMEGDSPSDYLCMFVYRVQYSSYNWEPSSPMQGYTVHLVRKP